MRTENENELKPINVVYFDLHNESTYLLILNTPMNTIYVCRSAKFKLIDKGYDHS